MKEQQQFRKMLQYFYSRANKLEFGDVYLKTLQYKLDNAQIEPIHMIATKQNPDTPQLSKNKNISPLHKRKQFLFKSNNFTSVFLFAFLLQALKYNNIKFLKDLHGTTINSLFAQDKALNQIETDSMALKIDKVFEFLYLIHEKNYQSEEIVDVLFKKFYFGLFENKSLKKQEKQKYTSQSALFLPFLLSNNTKIYTSDDIILPNSQAYENNQLDFNILLKNSNNNQQWIIGEGKNCITIFKDKLEYYIEKKNYHQNQSQDDWSLDQVWQEILQDSTDLRKQYTQNSLILTENLSLTFEKSPASRRGPKSANFDPISWKGRQNFFLP